ncbi:hypothetical protein SAMN04488063_0470 [Halopelagius inordinatus]|uniref:Uncharacterized protein n=1 Tax=Halopelagius inordinatus TaxID=553467 RepID=A0A1I2LWS3_9EURY|nr:hypothetical protein [Halopelagius inordinatus]SFF83653.1 hypothetical protein SAMN04488063_0470 [Halopelagius inordinatus]
MADRASGDQSKHDAVVEKIAKELDEDQDYVRADDIDEFKDPQKVNDHVPDISVGVLPSTVIEVETDTSDDAGQRLAFKEWAEEKSFRTYKGVLAKSRSRWEEFEQRD